MRGQRFEQSWSEFLDKEKQNLLLVKYVFSEDFVRVNEFTVIQLLEESGTILEVVKFDCSEKETVHVHRFFSKGEKKKYLKKTKSFESLEDFVKDIRENWRLYRARFEEVRP